MTAISDSYLREHLDDVLLRAKAGEHFTVIVGQRPVAALRPPDAAIWVSGSELRRVWQTPAPMSLRTELDSLDR